ncbi:BRCA1-associated RING domain protein 1 [Dispira simplex]|nr:BRCA1-associated RING domain protein 1 [Dispira simplex]
MDEFGAALGLLYKQLQCTLCVRLMDMMQSGHSPSIRLRKGYVLEFYGYGRRECITEYLGDRCQCPICQLPARVGNLRHNPSYDTLTECVQAIHGLASSSTTGQILDDQALARLHQLMVDTHCETNGHLTHLSDQQCPQQPSNLESSLHIPSQPDSPGKEKNNSNCASTSPVTTHSTASPSTNQHSTGSSDTSLLDQLSAAAAYLTAHSPTTARLFKRNYKAYPISSMEYTSSYQSPWWRDIPPSTPDALDNESVGGESSLSGATPGLPDLERILQASNPSSLYFPYGYLNNSWLEPMPDASEENPVDSLDWASNRTTHRRTYSRRVSRRSLKERKRSYQVESESSDSESEIIPDTFRALPIRSSSLTTRKAQDKGKAPATSSTPPPPKRSKGNFVTSPRGFGLPGPSTSRVLSRSITELLATAPQVPFEAKILITSLGEDELARLNQSLKQAVLHPGFFRVTTLPDVPPSGPGRKAPFTEPPITHVVTTLDSDRLCPRTLKYMYGVLAGAHIVSYEWVIDSIAVGRRLDEQPYLARGDLMFNNAQCSTTSGLAKDQGEMGPSLARIAWSQGKPQLLHGWSFYSDTSLDNTPSNRETIRHLVCFGGGKVLTRLPAPVDSTENIRNTSPDSPVVLVPPDHPELTLTAQSPGRRTRRATRRKSTDDHVPLYKGYCVRSTTWLFNCISGYTMLE